MGSSQEKYSVIEILLISIKSFYDNAFEDIGKMFLSRENRDPGNIFSSTIFPVPFYNRRETTFGGRIACRDREILTVHLSTINC